MTATTTNNRLNHYDILSVPSDASQQDIKRAYKERLLNIHPDKSSSSADSPPPTISHVTVNQIQEAYRILSKPESRTKYDMELLETFKKLGYTNNGDGLDAYSLDNFEFDEDHLSYHMACPRCKTHKGFDFTEDTLEEYGQERPDGEGFQVLAQCNSCSLWLKVNFDVADDYSDE
ncbi:hypothetical protein NCAS_0H00550 [Naumovozyma castellii]|uniref:Diphthamide biosynthesis protein 4 n=1 Tax=Naumovozyma castellii TaxID=27288 RepID=G0VIN9_NAUCA|nr:hypothetical protein NCAS_0H00550 [Naumovozyma castellii CBS 4309]CCC71365.1 hypothetical protein NCAS_0H00550 [Naumovozyma castellii CBS 4309]